MPLKHTETGFAARLQEIRQAKGLTQRALAKLAGFNVRSIAKLEQGVQDPTWATVVALVDALGIEVENFWVPKAERRRQPVKRMGRPSMKREKGGPRRRRIHKP